MKILRRYGILNEIYSITDEKTLKVKYERLQQIYEEDRPYIGLYFSRITTVSSKSVSLSGKTNWFNVFLDITNWHRRS